MRNVLDECSLAYKGHLSIGQFNPNKPNKHHIKAFALCCAQTAYCLAFWFYGGKKWHEYDKKLGIPADLMINKLTRETSVGLKFDNHVLYVDNWYNSMNFVKFLAEHLNMRVVGTVRCPNTAAKNPGPNTLPFHQPKKSTAAALPKGWTRQAELEQPLPTGLNNVTLSYRVAAALVQDKCMFGMLHSAYTAEAEPKHVIMRKAVAERVTAWRDRLQVK